MYAYCILFSIVAKMLSAINDPDRALERKRHKLKRREYHAQ